MLMALSGDPARQLELAAGVALLRRAAEAGHAAAAAQLGLLFADADPDDRRRALGGGDSIWQ